MAGRSAPIDRKTLERIGNVLAGTDLCETVAIREDGDTHLEVALSEGFYPAGTTATIWLRWYVNDDFGIHYREVGPGGEWGWRWDRHPNPHNDRDHYHPPPDPDVGPAEDATWPADHRDVMARVIDAVRERIDDVWS